MSHTEASAALETQRADVLYFDLGNLPSSGTQGYLTWNPEANPDEVEVKLEGALDVDDVKALTAILETARGCLMAPRLDWRRERLMREAGFTPVRQKAARV